MNILILGGDGYLGWPTAMHFANNGHEVTVVDNYLRRDIAKETNSEPLIDNPLLEQRAAVFNSIFKKEINVRFGDLREMNFMSSVVKEVKPNAIIHYAEQPSAPYSMRGFDEAHLTFQNNLSVTFNCIWSIIQFVPDCHLIKLGTMGEYGTPNIDIEEGWIDITHKGRSQKFLYPRAASSLYHTTKVLDTDLIWFYVRLYNLKVTDLMQGPVYGIFTSESTHHQDLLPNFHYDDIFGTVINRFVVQAAAELPLSVYGKGGQTRGYLNIRDTLKCIDLATKNPPEGGTLNIFNQVTETFTVNELATRIVGAAKTLGLNTAINHIPNPRVEAEEHYYNPAYTGLLELGLKPDLLSEDVIISLIKFIQSNREKIDTSKILPRVTWS